MRLNLGAQRPGGLWRAVPVRSIAGGPLDQPEPLDVTRYRGLGDLDPTDPERRDQFGLGGDRSPVENVKDPSVPLPHAGLPYWGALSTRRASAPRRSDST